MYLLTFDRWSADAVTESIDLRDALILGLVAEV
jgi:hypothetical protein